jgi:hypothetical protein
MRAPYAEADRGDGTMTVGRMNVDELIEAVAQSPLREHAAWFRWWHRPMVAIRTTSSVRPGGSRFGGAPDLPIGTAWPRHEKGPYRFLAQIDLAELAPHCASFAAPWSEALPKEGLLVLFVADDPTGEIDPEGEIFWGDPRYATALLVDKDAALAPQSPPAEVDYGAPIGIAFEPGVDIPYSRDQVSDWPFAKYAYGTEEYVAYDRIRWSLREAEWRDAHHLFGYPTGQTLAYDPTPAGQIPLLTLASNEERDWGWHDDGHLMLFLRRGALQPGWCSLAADAG